MQSACARAHAVVYACATRTARTASLRWNIHPSSLPTLPSHPLPLHAAGSHHYHRRHIEHCTTDTATTGGCCELRVHVHVHVHTHTHAHTRAHAAAHVRRHARRIVKRGALCVGRERRPWSTADLSARECVRVRVRVRV
uniref:Uncharacterized protein n=1 Tax=Erythrolobus australicus TaxID=1077150 RepID=A0A7S1TJT3_9RHOD